ncbi:MAG TPA: MbnP family protein [Puia sp.]
MESSPVIKGFLLIMLLLFMITSFRNSEMNSTLIIHYKAYVHGEPLQLNKKYKNPFGEIYSISRFRFYVGRIAPIYTDTALKPNHSSPYQLIDFSDSSSTMIEFPATMGTCNGIQFELGIDSVDQNQGAQSGPLDPIKGMFWTWNSGYQSFKIEGFSPLSDQPANMIAYHIGGYRYPYSTVWKIKMNTTNDEVFRITNEYKIIVEVPVELDYFFDGPTPLRIKEISSCTTPGELARKISENFIGSFTGLTLTSIP